MYEAVGRNGDALELLHNYDGDIPSSTLNMRFCIAAGTNDVEEITLIFKDAHNSQCMIPDFHLNMFLSTLYVVFNQISESVNELNIESETSKKAYHKYLAFLKDDTVNIEWLQANETFINPVFKSFIASIYKSKISLQKAICTLKDCVDYHIINLHSHLLTEHIKKDKIYAQELYHILRELRKEGESDLNMLATELNMSEKIQDYKNSLEITTELIRRCPDNTKSKTWNKLKMIEKWIETHCAVVTIEEKLNYELNNLKSPTADILMDSILLATRGHLLLTKDWHYQH